MRRKLVNLPVETGFGIRHAAPGRQKQIDGCGDDST